MDKPGMFRQTPGVVRRGIAERAESADPSPRVPGIERPVWRSFVGNEAFQKVNKPLVEDEQRRMAEAARPDPRPPAARVPKWKSGIGTLQLERPDGIVEDYDPESLLDDPEVGGLAAESLFKRDVKALMDERESLRHRLSDPSDKRKLTAAEREEILLTGSSLAETDPQHVALKKRLMDDEARTADEQRVYDLETKARELSRGGVAAWRANREAARGVQERAGRIAAKELEIDAAEEAAVAEEAALDEQMRRGVRGSELQAVEARKAEIAAARQGMEAARAGIAAERSGVAAAARREADAMDGVARKPARQQIETLAKDAGVFASMTDALTTAKDKRLVRGPDGKWQTPLMSSSNFDSGPMEGITGAAMSLAGRFGAQSTALHDGLEAIQKKNGFTDEEMQAAWDDLGAIYRKFEDGEKARVTSDGQLVPNAEDPDWLDTAKATVIIEGSAASPESKAATLRNLPKIQQQIAQAKAQSYEEAVKERIFADEKIPLFSEFAKSNPGTLPEQVRAFEAKHLNTRGAVEKWRDAKYASFIAGWNKADQTIFGAAALGLDAAGVGKPVADYTRGEAARLTTSSSRIKDAAGSDGLVGSLIEELPSIAVQGFLTRGMGGVVGAATGSVRLGQASAAFTAYTTAGAQSAGATYASEIAAGTDMAQAQQKALKAGANTAIITAVFGAGALGGVERVAVGRAAEMTVRDIAAMARQKGVLNVAKSPELRKFVAGVLKSAGGEATEEGIDELLGAFLTADPDTNLADAWSNAVEAAAVGGFIGGAIDVASGATQDSEWQKQVLESTPEDRAARVSAEIAAVNPTAAPADPEEIAAAEEVVGPFGAGPDSQALEEQIAAASPEEAAELRGKRGKTAAGEVAAGVEIVREIAAEEAAADEAVANAEEDLAVAMESGDPVELEQATAAVEVARAGRSKPARTRGVLKIARGETLETLTDAEVRSLGITRDGKPAKEEELASVGLAKPVVEVLGDGSLVILDEALAELSPTARKRVKMGEAEARKKAVERQSAPAVESPGVLSSPGAPAGQKFTVTGRAGTVVEVEAADEAAAQVAGAEALPMGETVASVSVTPAGSPAETITTPSETVTGAVSSPETVTNVRPAIVKQIAKLKKALGKNVTVTDDPAARAVATDAGIVINPSRLIDEAAADGLTDTEADQWIQGVIDEEVRHFAHLQASRELWKASGTKQDLESWRADYYGAMWREEFAGERGETVAKLYGSSFDSLPDDDKAMEGLRMMSQQLATGSPTEVARLWVDVGPDTPRIIKAIREALKALKSMVQSLSPALKAEIAAIEAQLSKYEQNAGVVSDRGEKSPEVRQAGGDVRGSRPGSDREAPGGREADTGAGGAVLPAGQGGRVSFTRGGQRRSGVALQVASSGKTLVKLDDGRRVLVEPDEIDAAPVENGPDLATAEDDTAKKERMFAWLVKPKSLRDGWYEFSEKSGTLGIPRAEMPQIAAEDRSAMVQFLRARGIDYVEEEVLPGTLKPTQAEFSAEKVDKARAFTGGDRAILISGSGHLVDGHHQWVAKWFDAPDTPIRVIRLKASIRKVLAAVKEMPSAEVAPLPGFPKGVTRGKTIVEVTSGPYKGRHTVIGLDTKGQVAIIGKSGYGENLEPGSWVISKDQKSPTDDLPKAPPAPPIGSSRKPSAEASPNEASAGDTAAAQPLKVGDMVKIRSETAPGGFMGPYKIWRITGNTAKVKGPVRSLSFNLESLERVETQSPPAKPDLEQLSKDRAKIIVAVADVPAVVNAIRNTPQNAQYTVAEEIRRVLVNMLNAETLSAASYDYFARNVGNEKWVETVIRDVEKGMAPAVDKPKDQKWTFIGKNLDGEFVDQDSNNVRSVVRDGVRITQSVRIAPGGGMSFDGPEILWSRGRDEFVTRDEAQQITGKTLRTLLDERAQPPTTPAPAPQITPTLSAGDSQILGALDGLFAAPLRENYDKDIPSDRFMALMGAANTLVGEGVTTPEALVAKFSTLAEGRLKPFTQKVWFALKSAGAKGPSEPDWDALYAPAEEATEEEEAPAGRGSEALRLADKIADRIRAKEKINIQTLTAMAEQEFGGKTGEGWSIKDAYDAVEMAINLMVLDSGIDVNVSADQALRNIATIRGWLEYIPTQTRRTGEMDQLQQFSTPPHFAYASAWVAKVTSRDVGLEPSAGLGGLASWMSRAGADVWLNELSPRRREMLDALRIGPPSTGHDAGLLHAIMLPAVNSGRVRQPTVVVMNPPFSNNAAGRKDLLTGGQHIEEALKLLADGGRLVAIVGEGMAMDAPRYQAWWSKIAKKYSVRANIHMDGSEYRKYGTTFSNRILVIDKVAPTGEAVIGGEASKIEDLIPMLDGVRTTRPALNERNSPAPDQPGGDSSTEEGEAGSGDISGSADSGTGETGPDSGGTGSVRGGRRPGGKRGGRNAGKNGTSRSGNDTAANSDGRPDQPGGQDTVGDEGAVGSDLTIEEANDDKAEVDQNEIFSAYRPLKVRIKGSQPHPSSLVESSSMASVELPAIRVTPNIPTEAVTSGALSDAQLEVIAYAAQAHETVFDDGVRQGFFIGDGTGVGKGREIAGTILHNWREGRKKAVWISEKKGLFQDAGRDFRGIGGGAIPLADMASKVTAPDGNGVAFLTYDGLKENFEGLDQDGKPVRSKPTKPSRVENLLAWLGKDFDGVIALDEAHNAGNLLEIKKGRGMTKPAAAALAVDHLQTLFPNARIVYASATGATEPQNIAFASRLGLWGQGRAFTTARDFYQTIKSAGISAMEIFARDLKSMGLYMARTLSFKGENGDNVEFARLEHELTQDQEETYRRAAEGWQTIFTNIDSALDASGAQNSRNARSAAMSALFGSQQRFFNNLLTSLQMPTVLADMKRRLDEGGSVVVQLVNTNEEALNRALVRAIEENPENPDLESLDLSNRQDMLEYINNSFPTAQFVERPTGQTRADGTPVTQWVPLVNENGDAVENPEAVEMKNRLLQEIATIPLPDPPIEQIINFFGHENVAEITGRKKRVVIAEDENGQMRRKIESKRGDARLNVEKDEFLEGKRRVLIFSNKGGTGFSYHAGKSFKNQQRRFQYVIQPGWRADKAIQGLGRTHRADQVRSPFFILAGTNVRGHQRFISTIARRLQQLGALTSGERKSTGQGLFSADDNLHDEYGEDAVTLFFIDLFNGRIPGLSFIETTSRLGYVKTIGEETRSTLVDDAGTLNRDKIPSIDQFLNRILALPIKEQNAVYDAFMERRMRFIERAKQNGTFDMGVETFDAPEAEIVSDEVVYQSEENSSKTRLAEIKYKRFYNLNRFESVNKKGNRFYQNRRTGKVHAYEPASGTTTTLADGRVVNHVWKYSVRGLDRVGENEITDEGKAGARPGFVKVGDTVESVYGTFRITSLPEADGPPSKRAMMVELVDGQPQKNSSGEIVEQRFEGSILAEHYNKTGNVVEGVNENANYLPDNYILDAAEAKRLWTEQFDEHPKFEEKRATFIVGTIIPVWHRIPKFYKKVKRVNLANGDSFLGVEVPEDQIQKTRDQLGASAADITPSAAVSAIIDSKATVLLSNGWRAKYTMSAGEPRIEVDGLDANEWSSVNYDRPKWEAYFDGFMERIQFRPRFFLAQNAKAMDALFRYAPPMEIQYPQGPRLSAAPLSDSRDARMVRLLQARIDRAYETGNTEGVEEFEARLETLLERMDTDSAAMEAESEQEFDAANPSPEQDLVDAWFRWTGRGQINARDMADNREEFPNFGQFYRSVIGDGAFGIREGITDQQIEEAARESAAFYEARRSYLKGLQAAPLVDPEMPADDRARAALDKNKQHKFGALRGSGPLKVSFRLDLPSANRGTPVVSIHEPGIGTVIAYDTAVHLRDVRFRSRENEALKIRDGKAKSPMAAVEGTMVAVGRGVEVPAGWTPVRYNPKVHSYFFTADGTPVVSAEEAMQIGGRVYAKGMVHEDPAKFLFAAPLSDSETPENIRRLTERGRATMAGAEIEEEARRQQEAFADQGKVIGTPRLANISSDEAVRGEMDVIDEMRKFTRTRQDKTKWERDGRALADADENAVVENWLANAFSDEGQAIQAKDVVAARIVMERRVKAAGNDLDKHADNAVLMHGYREARANQARVLAAGTDPFKNPEERYRDYLAGVIYELPPRVIAEIEDRSRTPAAAREAIRKAVRVRLETVEKALKKLGVTLDEITGGQVFLSLSQTAVMKDTLSRLSPAEKTAVKAIQAGGTVADVRRKSGLSDERIQSLAAQVRKELADKLRAKVAAGLRLEDLKDEMKGLRAASLSAADIEAELERILTIGFGIPEKVPTARLPKKKRVKPQPLEKTDWNRPVFTDALASFEFDTKDRSEIMARVVTLRDIAGADGRIATLTGEKKARAVRLVGEINRVLAKYNLTADKVLKEGTDPDSYRFDITDRVHVMILARTIRALDADIVDKATEYYYSSILSGLQTMMVNATGALNSVWQATVDRGVEAAINLAARDPQMASFAEVKYMLKAMGPMLSRAWSNAQATWAAETPFFDEDILGRTPDLVRMQEGTTGYKTGAVSGTKGRILRIPGRILMATDDFMNTARAVAEVGAMAYRFAVAQGLKPGTAEFDKLMKQQVNVPGSEAWQMAAQRALVGTFNNALPGQRDAQGRVTKIRTLTDLAGGAIYGLTHSKWLQAEADDQLTVKLLKTIPKILFFPFVRVPFNILKQGIERSVNPISLLGELAPLFLHNIRFRDGKFTMNAGGDKARIMELVGKQVQGAFLMILLAALGEGDDDDLEKPLIVTGSRPFGDTKKGERELGYRLGLGPYEISMKLPGGKRVGFSYGRLEPAATVLGGTVDTLKNAKAAARGRMGGGDALAKILSSFVAQGLDKTSLRGAADLQGILAGEKPLDRFTADRIGAIMPNIIKQAVRESDPVFREKPDDFMEMLARAVWPRGGPAAMDVYGEAQDKKGNSISRILDFTDFGGDEAQPYDAMLWRYKQKNPDPKVYYTPQSAPTTYTVNGVDKQMNAAQAARFKETAGKRTLVRLKATPLNLTDPTEADIKRFRDAVDAGRDDARKILFKSPAWQNLK